MAYTKKQKEEFKEKAQEKTQDLLKQISTGIQGVLNSENYKKFLDFQSKFHTYSFNNTMLIYMQRPDATNVAGYKQWTKFERHVMKGQKGISILAPYIFKTQKEENVVDKKTGQAVKNPDGTIKTQKVEGQYVTFHSVAVFDVKQTEGKELPEICKELQGNSINASNIIKAIKGICKIPIIEKNITNGAKGYFSPAENIIAINKGMSEDQTAKTIVHEYTHSVLHSGENDLNRATKEVQAESVAYIVSKNMGLDTSSYSFEYLAAWSTGRELKELKESFDLIQKTADNIVNKVQDYLSPEHQEQQQENTVASLNTTDKAANVKNEIVQLYKDVFPAIKNITEETAAQIKNFNSLHGTISVDNFKTLYMKVGKKIESNNYNKEDLLEFKAIKSVIDDFKQAKLTEKQSQAHENVQSQNVQHVNEPEL